ncbi:MAG: B12-binding domain-containing radical SAM protein [Cyclobacteriaceae bacterium]
MNVLLTHGYFLSEDEKEQQIMRPYPPLGLLYISSFLNENGIANQIFDSTFSTKSELFQTVRDATPEVIAIYTNLMTKVNVLEIATKSKSINPNTKIILGGPDVTYNTLDYLQNGADYIVIGEGENTMLELVKCISSGSIGLEDIPGIAYLNDNGTEVKTKPRLKVREVDDLPIPNRDGIDISKYLKAWKDFHGESALNVSTQRGCPYTCKWCSTAVYGQSYRRRSPQKVVVELKVIQDKYNPDTIWFVDDVFTVSHKWLNAFAEELELQKVKVKFECISRADRMSKEVIATLKRAGCFRVWIGAESGSQRIVDAMDRRVSVEQVREMIQDTRKAGIEAGTFIMLGYPGETEEDIKETINHLKIANPDHFTITVAYPIKGTSLYNEIEAKQTVELDWAKSTDRDRDFVRTYPRKYYQYAVTKVVNEVNYYNARLNSNSGYSKYKMKTKAILASIGMKMIRSLSSH